MSRRGLLFGVAVALVLTAAALAAGLGTGGSNAVSKPWAKLHVVVWAQGQGEGTAKRYQIACPSRAPACAALKKLGPHPFREVPRTAVCTQIYGGAQVALLSGALYGHAVKTKLALYNGCQISRWQRLKKVVPIPPGTLGP